ncbi:MAG: hypothetical protein ACHRHE_09975 [Tepidisphaerales bacterium]
MTNSAPGHLACTHLAADEFWFLRWIVRLRWVCFILVALVLLAGYNGQWRVRSDSALYRGLGRSLAAGRGYTFRGEYDKQAYPGLPILLAGVERVFGRQDDLRPTATLWVMLVLAGATLVCIYHLILEHFPRWIAVCVTTGVGINQQFIQQAHEIMTDLPFLLGVSLTLLAMSRVRRATAGSARILWAGLLMLGAATACSMRPTMWVLVAAGIGAAILHIIRTRRWKAPVLAIGVLVAFVAVWAAAFSGRHERSVIRHIQNLWVDHSPSQVGVADRLGRLFGAHVPEAVLGFEMPLWTGIPFTAMLFGLAAWRARFLPVWGLYSIVTFAMFLVMGSNTRYLLMVLPMLLVEWALLCHALARWLIPLIPWRFTPDWAMLATLAFATVIQAALAVNLVLEQHGRSYKNHFQRTDFLVSYRNGDVLALKQLADAIRQWVPAGARLLGPEGRITSFLSGRNVYDSADLFANKAGPQWAPAVKDKKITWVAWGPRFPEESRVSKLLRPAPRQPLLKIEDGAWWTIEPSARERNGRPRGLFLGRLYQPPSLATTRSATRPANAPAPVPSGKLPGVELPAVINHRPPTRPAPVNPPRARGSN